MESEKYKDMYHTKGYLNSENKYLEQCIKYRNKKKTELYEEIELLNSYNTRDRAVLEENTRQELELLKSMLFEDIGISEDKDLRGVFVIFNKKFEYIRTISLNNFSEFIENKEKYSELDTEFEMLCHYLKSEGLYADEAKHFINKELKWYKKTFKAMILSLGWKVDKDGLLLDLEW